MAAALTPSVDDLHDEVLLADERAFAVVERAAWEPHQTTFGDYVPIAFAMGGMPGWLREPVLTEAWAVPDDAQPAWLLELGRELLQI